MDTRAKRKTPATSDPLKIVVRFQLPYLAADEVFLAGSFNDWHPQMFPMIEAEDHGWVKELALAPGTYEYRFVADGKWLADPGNPNTTPDPFGGLNSVIVVAEPLPKRPAPSSPRSKSSKKSKP